MSATPIDSEATHRELAIHPALGESLDLPLLRQIVAFAEELPAPSTLSPGTRVTVSAGQASRAGRLARLLTRRPRHLHLAVRCSALLLRGYVDVAADPSGLAVGYAP